MIELPIKTSEYEKMKWILKIIKPFQNVNIDGNPLRGTTKRYYDDITLVKSENDELPTFSCLHENKMGDTIHLSFKVKEMRLTRTGGLKIKTDNGTGYNFTYDLKEDVIRDEKINIII